MEHAGRIKTESGGSQLRGSEAEGVDIELLSMPLDDLYKLFKQTEGMFRFQIESIWLERCIVEDPEGYEKYQDYLASIDDGGYPEGRT